MVASGARAPILRTEVFFFMKETTVVKQYKCHLRIPSKSGSALVCDLVGDELDPLKEHVNKILMGGATFNPARAINGGEGVLLIYHSKFDSGKRSIGWISLFEVPEAESAGAMVEQLSQVA